MLRREVRIVESERRSRRNVRGHGRAHGQGDKGHHAGDGGHVHDRLRDFQAHHAGLLGHGMGRSLLRGHGADRGAFKTTGAQMAEAIKNVARPPPRRTSRYRATGRHRADDNAGLRSGHVVQGVCDEAPGGPGTGSFVDYEGRLKASFPSCRNFRTASRTCPRPRPKYRSRRPSVRTRRSSSCCRWRRAWTRSREISNPSRRP